MARKRKKMEEGEVEANLIPIMNVMFLLIPALLLAMEVARFAAISVSPPKYAAAADKKEDEPKKEEKKLELKVFIMEDGFRVQAAGQQSGAEAGGADSNKPSIPLKKPGAPLEDHGRYDYDRLEAQAKEYRRQAPKSEHTVTISAENTIPLQVLTMTMDALRGRECKEAVPKEGEPLPDECLFLAPIIEAGAG